MISQDYIQIIDAYNCSLYDMGKLQFSLPARVIDDPHFIHIQDGKQLIDIGIQMENCLTRINKLRYYVYRIINDKWCLYHIVKDGYHALATFDINYVLLEIEGSWMDGEATLNEACTYGRGITALLAGRNRKRANYNDKYIKELKQRQQWERFLFTGTREDLPYQAVKSVLRETNDNITTIIVTDPTQENNYRHKIITTHHITSTESISIDTFDKHGDCCFRKYTLHSDSIKCIDVNDDPIISFDVVGTKYE